MPDAEANMGNTIDNINASNATHRGAEGKL
jgi:hypothetical protein